MSEAPDSPLDHLWQEYGRIFKRFDDLSLARWLAQTLGQFVGSVWRHSHPLVGVYRLAAQEGHERQIWFKRLATAPRDYVESPCCRAPLLPLLTRDIVESGLVCLHCNGTAVAFEDVSLELQKPLQRWSRKYSPVHDVAHWEDRQKEGVPDYTKACEEAAEQAEDLLRDSGAKLAPRLLELYPAVVWEDQDECLDVRPEDIVTWRR